MSKRALLKEAQESSYKYIIGSRRPPSEAKSLLLCIHKGCQWNKCHFCVGYKQSPYFIRPLSHVLKDIDLLKKYVMRIQTSSPTCGCASTGEEIEEPEAFHMALHWHKHGMKSVFLQESDPFHIRPDDLLAIVQKLSEAFPTIERITAYGRSKSIARIPQEMLDAIAKAGLNRVHIGLESGSDTVLAKMDKGVNKELNIAAGLMCKKAGIEVSENVMPGLGGVALSEEHVRETADALNQINPDIILLRTLAIPEQAELADDVACGHFSDLTEVQKVQEIRQLLLLLNVTSHLRSDHCCNLLDLDGRLPDDKPKLLALIDTFLSMPTEDQMLYRIGKRAGMLRDMDHFKIDSVKSRIKMVVMKYGITPENADSFTSQMTGEMF